MTGQSSGPPPGAAAAAASMFAALRSTGCRTLNFAGHDVLEVCFQRNGAWFHCYIARCEDFPSLPTSAPAVFKQLAQLGCRVTMAGDGVEALAALGKPPAPDVILMDCHMPNLDGWETTRRIRGLAREADEFRRQLSLTPVIALTAAALPEERARCQASGMNEFISKPVKVGELHAVLRRYARPATPEKV